MDGKEGKRNTKGLDLKKVINLATDKELLPCIVFCFSKRMTEENAMLLRSRQWTTDEEQQKIEEIFGKAMGCLAKEDWAQVALGGRKLILQVT